MEAVREPLRPIGVVLGAGVLAGVIAGAAAGAIDAVWEWGPADQFVPGVLSRLRFVVYVTVAHAAAGAVIGLAATAVVLALSRASRLGDMLRHGWQVHLETRALDPRRAVGGLALALAGLPIAAIALYVAFRAAVPYVTGRKEMGLVVIVAMGAALAALAIAVPLAFLVARALEEAIAPLVKRVPVLASPFAPLVALGVLVAGALLAWVASAWETARLLPLHGPAVLGLGLVLAIAAARPGLALAVRVRERPGKQRIAVWAALPVVLLVAMLVLGGSDGVIKATVGYTGLGGEITRTVRSAFDWDRDGYARFLGGGDCDDGDRTVHPGAPEIPDDGIDQNCIGGDASAKATGVDTAFAPVPASIPPDFRILLVTIDTVRADHFGMYGYNRNTTPNLDVLAKDATVFEHGWAHAPSTRYSMPAILTGRLPLEVRYDLSVNWPGLLPKAYTIAEHLKELGFSTGAITNYDYFKELRHFNQGFDEYDNTNERLHGGVPGKGPEETKGSSSKEQTDKAIAFVDRHAQQRWFLWVHYYDPHRAYEAHPEVTFGSDEIALYDGEIAFTDRHIGRLIDHLKETGQYDKTVIVVTGDHGEGFHEHGEIYPHGYHIYAQQTKVPLIMRVPSVAGRRAATPAGHVDILPTLVNLAGGKPDGEMMGHSLVDVIAGTEHDDRVVFQQLSYENNNEKRGAVSRDCHVIYNVSPDPSWEVYRDDHDPAEAKDLSSDDECASTREALERWYDFEQVPPGAAEALVPARPAVAKPVDADLGSAVHLIGCEAPATARPGDSIDVTWSFEAKDTVPAGWKLFAHLYNPAKQQVVNFDHVPARPFEWWKPGQFIRYPTNIQIPRTAPRGTYAIGVGLFKAVGGERAKVTASGAPVANNEVTCTTIEVAP